MKKFFKSLFLVIAVGLFFTNTANADGTLSNCKITKTGWQNSGSAVCTNTSWTSLGNILATCNGIVYILDIPEPTPTNSIDYGTHRGSAQKEIQYLNGLGTSDNTIYYAGTCAPGVAPINWDCRCDKGVTIKRIN